PDRELPAGRRTDPDLRTAGRHAADAGPRPRHAVLPGRAESGPRLVRPRDPGRNRGPAPGLRTRGCQTVRRARPAASTASGWPKKPGRRPVWTKTIGAPTASEPSATDAISPAMARAVYTGSSTMPVVRAVSASASEAGPVRCGYPSPT